jgi:hypothetical protein
LDDWSIYDNSIDGRPAIMTERKFNITDTSSDDANRDQ